MSDLYMDQDGDFVIVTPRDGIWVHESCKYYTGPWIRTNSPEAYGFELLEKDFDRPSIYMILKNKALEFLKTIRV